MQYQSNIEKSKRLKIAIWITLIITVSIALVLFFLFVWASMLFAPSEFSEPDYNEVLSGYKTRLHIYLPARQPDFCEDTHGGIGDGDTIFILNLSNEEISLLSDDITANKNWLPLPLSSDDANILFGGSYCIKEVNGPIWVEGLLDGQIKRLDSGYYCIFNKQTEKHESLNNGEASYNFIFVEYDVKNNKIYIQEFDS